MKDRQRCQSEAEARLSVGSAIAVPAITISLKKAASRLPGSIDAKSPKRTVTPIRGFGNKAAACAQGAVLRR